MSTRSAPPRITRAQARGPILGAIVGATAVGSPRVVAQVPDPSTALVASPAA